MILVKRKKSSKIQKFHFRPGTILAKKYEVVSLLGSGWESEVYMIRELGTRIERAAKIFFPHRNESARVATRYARKLHKLRNCPILIQYHTKEEIEYKGAKVSMLVSEYVEGEVLSSFLKRQRRKRISVFQGVHLLHALAVGLEPIHKLREYHGDLHSDNIIIKRHGLGFDLKLLDFFDWGRYDKENAQADMLDAIKVFYDSIGGQKYYSKHPKEVKDICCGLRRSLIVNKFRNFSRLREHLETMSWS